MAVTQLIPNTYRLDNAFNLLNAVANGNYYGFAGTSSTWSGAVPQYYDTPSVTQFLAYNNMLFGKKIQPNNVSIVCSPAQWTSGTVYAMYDDQSPNLSTSNFYVYTFDGSYYYIFKCLYNNNGAPSTTAPTFVGYTIDTLPFKTSDSYLWKYMYKLDLATYQAQAVSTFLPVVPDANVVAAAVSGSIDVIVPVDANNNIVASTGTGYNNYFSGKLFAVPATTGSNPIVAISPGNSSISIANTTTNFYAGCYFYVTGGTGTGQYQQVVGSFANGNGTYVVLANTFANTPDTTSSYTIGPAVIVTNASDVNANVAAMGLVSANNGNSIYSVQILNSGSLITSASAYVNVNSTLVGVSDAALLRVIVPPKGGHGANVYSELYCNAVSLTFTFANSESSTIPTINQYQTVGLLANPLFANVTFTLTGANGAFFVGETVTQTINTITSSAVVVGTATNQITVTNCSPTFVTSTNGTFGTLVDGANSALANAQITGIQISGVTKGFTTFTQYYRYTTNNTLLFSQGETVYQKNLTGNSATYSNAIFYGNNVTGNTVYLTAKQGPLYIGNTIIGATTNATAYINTSYGPDLVVGSGDVLYLENFAAISRSNTATETVKILLQF